MKAASGEISGTHGQKRLAEDTRAYLMAHMDRRVTLKELCDVFDYSGTYIKNCFKHRYGVPVATFIKREKMWEACRLLRETSHGILEIAGMLGYENGSKFANAFRSVMNVTPGIYRRADKEQAEALLSASKSQ